MWTLCVLSIASAAALTQSGGATDSPPAKFDSYAVAKVDFKKDGWTRDRLEELRERLKAKDGVRAVRSTDEEAILDVEFDPTRMRKTDLLKVIGEVRSDARLSMAVTYICEDENMSLRVTPEGSEIPPRERATLTAVCQANQEAGIGEAGVYWSTEWRDLSEEHELQQGAARIEGSQEPSTVAVYISCPPKEDMDAAQDIRKRLGLPPEPRIKVKILLKYVRKDRSEGQGVTQLSIEVPLYMKLEKD